MFQRLLKGASLTFRSVYGHRYFSGSLGSDAFKVERHSFKARKPKDIVTLSQSARSRLYDIIADGNKVVYLTLRVKGCNGYTYEMNMIDPSSIGDMDEKILDEDGKTILVIENKAVFYLIGSHIGYSDGDLAEGFTFENPNVTSKCGCGKSFQFG
ncbi:iron-sulfur cluster assembly accessory protein domain-containing protein [Theileria equi strain WA]|uniref:Iron-sulfur cluster assembly accessory protein domain-containing protein n=1 Tax=Theileria equi strain WA TaxID=1537102 RepID=L0B0C6_THEEQ|nr:iron-sulfur cluster assembly accessory protein domain-containing protein [Theileria equi strain WA]AFZ81270.1 iron-sulfur cluster assembly accessory protein domain-containing protein [Theileria equi strain WA]|eukprot:XP_004830936.1 iron-sulfur cluster assembly accessory protein domain-containing protein [Theileria equi strain WA]